ncbi:MAG: 23S ribosomal RNA methyltransferase Erm [Defluviitaleaceae bacterium]|nr:23S ribosomal RNA methyltransferase Erm [Defluviitaleaceae bacterium]
MSKNINPPVWVSQNFLTGGRTISRLISKTSINESDHIVEIGPGKGHITQALLIHSKKVSAIEIDKNLYRKLQVKFDTSLQLKLYNQDFLKWNLPTTAPYKVFANIPFSHTTAIIKRLTESKNPPTDAWLIMEKGAAKRFMGIPCENLRSLMLKPLFDMNIIYHFRREDFHPMPKVDVVMVHLKQKATRDISLSQWKIYCNFITSALGNSGLTRIFTKKQLSRACRDAGLSDITSAEILYIQWLCLFRCYDIYVKRK